LSRKPILISKNTGKAASRGQATNAGRRNMANGAVTETALGCEEFDSLLAEVLVRTHLPQAAQQHLAECQACAAMVEDFEAIADSVRQLPPAETEPTSDLWPQIRETLLREGLIHASGSDCAPAPKLVQRAPAPRH